MSQLPSIARPARRAEGILQVSSHLRRPGLLVITAEGELDLFSAGLLRQALWQDLPRHTVLDLSGVSFLAAAGLRVLGEAAARARLEHRRLAVVAVTRRVTRMLRLYPLTGLPVYPRLADAVREPPM